MTEDLSTRKAIRAALRRRGFVSVDMLAGRMLTRFLDEEEEHFLSIVPEEDGGFESAIVTPGPNDRCLLFYSHDVDCDLVKRCFNANDLVQTLDALYPKTKGAKQ